MTIKVGDRVPDGTLTEFIETETAGCSLGPNAFQVADLARGKTIALFAVPGAFTPTCSAKHLPGYVEQAAALKAKASMKSGACPSTMRSSWAPGAANRRPTARSACWPTVPPCGPRPWAWSWT